MRKKPEPPIVSRALCFTDNQLAEERGAVVAIEMGLQDIIAQFKGNTETLKVTPTLVMDTDQNGQMRRIGYKRQIVIEFDSTPTPFGKSVGTLLQAELAQALKTTFNEKQNASKTVVRFLQNDTIQLPGFVSELEPLGDGRSRIVIRHQNIDEIKNVVDEAMGQRGLTPHHVFNEKGESRGI